MADGAHQVGSPRGGAGLAGLGGPRGRLGSTIADRYRLDDVLGEGAMGVVYYARDLVTDEVVALKTLRSRWRGQSTLVDRFAREATLLRELAIPGVLAFLDYGIADGEQFLVTEYLTGHSVQELLMEHGRIPARDAAFCACELLTVLGRVHSAGVVHRDIKPDNVFAVATGDLYTARLIDFGVARRIDARGGLTMPGVHVGTPHYMSPELIQSGTATPRSDVHAAAVVLYEMITGELPMKLEGHDILSVVNSVLDGERRPVDSLVPDVHPAIAAVVDHAVAHEGGFDSADEFLSALDGALGHQFRDSLLPLMFEGEVSREERSGVHRRPTPRR